MKFIPMNNRIVLELDKKAIEEANKSKGGIILNTTTQPQQENIAIVRAVCEGCPLVVGMRVQFIPYDLQYYVEDGTKFIILDYRYVLGIINAN